MAKTQLLKRRGKSNQLNSAGSQQFSRTKLVDVAAPEYAFGSETVNNLQNTMDRKQFKALVGSPFPIGTMIGARVLHMQKSMDRLSIRNAVLADQDKKVLTRQPVVSVQRELRNRKIRTGGAVLLLGAALGYGYTHLPSSEAPGAAAAAPAADQLAEAGAAGVAAATPLKIGNITCTGWEEVTLTKADHAPNNTALNPFVAMERTFKEAADGKFNYTTSIGNNGAAFWEQVQVHNGGPIQGKVGQAFDAPAPCATK